MMIKIALIIGLLVATYGWINFLPSFFRGEYPVFLLILILITLFIAIPGILVLISMFLKRK